MKIHKSIYKAFFVLFLVSLIYFPNVEYTVVSTTLVSLLLLAEKSNKISKTTFNTLLLLTLVVFLAFFSGVFHSATFINRIKDLIHLIKPISVILCGYLLIKKVNNTAFVFKTIFFLGFGMAVSHVLKFAFVDFKVGNIEEIRLRAGSGNFIEVISLLCIFSKTVRAQIKIQKLYLYFIFIVLACSVTLYFSRTMLVAFFLLLLSIRGFTKLSRKALEYGTVAIVLLLCFYAYLFTLDLDVDKTTGSQGFLFKIKNAPAEVFSTPDDYDPNNHKQIFRHWRGYEASRAFKQMKNIDFIIGKGLGSQVDLGFKAPIGGVDGLRYIPHLHNGYAYLILKAGFIGVFLYVIGIFNLVRRIYIYSKTSSEKFCKQVISGLGLYFFLSTFVITGLYNLEEISIFLLGVFLALLQLEKDKQLRIEHS